MSEFLQKSNYNISAADFLMRAHSLYAPSVHCAYYSCVQYMLHIIYTKLPTPIKDQYLNAIKIKTGSSHKLAIQVIKTELGKINATDFSIFQKKIAELKKSRVDSDYTMTQIGQGVSSNSIALAQSIRVILRTNFK